jgi:hypothetical protein
LARADSRPAAEGGAAIDATVDLAAAASPWAKAQEGLPSMYASAVGPSGYVAVGRNGTIVTSATGVTWTTRRQGAPLETLWAVTYGRGLFVAAGDRSRRPFFLTSPNGVAWTERSLEVSHRLHLEDIAYGNGRFVAVGGDDDEHAVAITSSDGVTWTTHRVEARGGLFLALAFGNGTFVGVASAEVLTSPDGVTWTPQPLPFDAFITDVIYDGSGFVACGSENTFTSPDGASWSVHPQEPGFFANRMAAGAGVITAVGPHFIQTSLDGGVTWTDRSAVPRRNGESREYQTVAYGKKGFVTHGFNGTVLTSPNGEVWTSRTAPASRYWTGVTSGDGYFCAVGRDGAVALSTDGVRWTNQGGFDPQGRIGIEPTSIVWGNGLFVVVDDLGLAYTSPDCARWSTSDPGGGAWLFEDVSHGDGFFVAVGQDVSTDAALIAVSVDGSHWQRRDVGLDASLESVAHGDGRWLAVGSRQEDGAFQALISDDSGLTWTPGTTSNPPPDVFSDVIHTPGVFTAVGFSVWTSPDGLDWTQRFESDRFLFGVAYGDGRFRAVGSGGLYASTDGVNWAPEVGVTGRSQSRIAFDANLKRFVAAGDSVITYTPSALPGGTVRFSASSYTVGEGPGGRTAKITVLRSGSLGDASVDYATSPGSANVGDYRSAAGTLRFLRGERVKSFTVEILDDDEGEGPETLNLRLRNPQGGTTLGSPATAVLTIKDDEPVIEFSSAHYVVSEKASRVSVVLTRSPGGCDAVPCEVNFYTDDATATRYADYFPTDVVVSFAANELRKTVTVPLLDDQFTEGSETFVLRLFDPSHASLGPRSTALVTIRDDDR